MAVARERVFQACITWAVIICSFLFYLFTVLFKAPDMVVPFCVTVLPLAAGCCALTVITAKNGDGICFGAMIFPVFLLIGGNAYQVVLGEVSPMKITLIHMVAVITAAAALWLYVNVIKKRLLTTKKGYFKAMAVTGAAIVFLFLVLLVCGSSINSARLWIKLPGGVTLQLSEIIKLLFYILLALIYNSNATVKQKILIGVGSLAVTSVFLAALNEFGTVLLLLTVYLITLFINVKNKYSLLIIAGFTLAILGSLLFVFGTHDAMASQTGFIPDKLNKVYARLTLADDDQMMRALQGMVNGGVFGADMDYLIDVFSIEADFAPAGIAQYFGMGVLIACIAAVCGLFYTVYLRSRDEALNERSKYKLAYIFALAIAVQAIFSLGGNIGVLPCAGIGFPGVSWGGTQITAFYIEAAFIVYGLQVREVEPAKKQINRSRFYVEAEVQQ